jgi:hypothetical protein
MGRRSFSRACAPIVCTYTKSPPPSGCSYVKATHPPSRRPRRPSTRCPPPAPEQLQGTRTGRCRMPPLVRSPESSRRHAKGAAHPIREMPEPNYQRYRQGRSSPSRHPPIPDDILVRNPARNRDPCSSGYGDSAPSSALTSTVGRPVGLIVYTYPAPWRSAKRSATTSERDVDTKSLGVSLAA